MAYHTRMGQVEFSPIVLAGMAVWATWPETPAYEVQVELVAPNGNCYYLPYGMVSEPGTKWTVPVTAGSLESPGAGAVYQASAVALPIGAKNCPGAWQRRRARYRKSCPGHLSPAAGTRKDPLGAAPTPSSLRRTPWKKR